VTGTAAQGAALAEAALTLVDAAGLTRTATTAADGTFTIDTTGLTPPFMLKLVSGDTTLFSVSAGASADMVVNVTPLTDLILRTWYDVQGISVDDAFAAPTVSPAPEPLTVEVIARTVQRVVQLWLDQAGVSGDFNLISTPFDADGTGFDQVLDQTTVDASTGTIEISDGDTTQITELSAADGSISVDTLTENATDGTSSSSSSTTVVPVGTAQETALAAITALADQFATTVNARGNALAAADLAPMMDPDLVADGWSRTQYAAMLAGYLAGADIAFTDPNILSLDGDVAKVSFQLAVAATPATAYQPLVLWFKNLTSGGWKLSGNGQIAETELRCGWSVNQGLYDSSNPILEVHVSGPEGTLDAVGITGGPWDAAGLGPPQLEIEDYGNREAFEIYSTESTVLAGTPFDLELVRAAGGSVTYTVTSNAVTAEPIAFNEDLGTALGDVIDFGTPVALSWTLPRTFAVQFVRLGRVAYDTSDRKCEAEQALSASATSGSVTIPATCNGDATSHAEIYVQAWGVNGEFTTAYYQLSGPPI
jgi:hypothetical protein